MYDAHVDDALPALTRDDVAVLARDVDITYTANSQSSRSLKQKLTRTGDGGGQRKIEAVRGVSIKVGAGEAVGIIGHNGSGKSTFLRAVGGLLPVTRGSIQVASVPVLLGVRAALETDLSARANVLLGGTALRIPRRTLVEQMDEIIEFAGLEEYIDLPISTFSSGMKARLQFAISTAVSPDILLIDEALSVGDAEFKARSDERIREMMDDASTVFLVSHSMKNITDICERVLWLHKGELIADGPAEDVAEAYEEHVGRVRTTRRRARRKRLRAAREDNGQAASV